MNRRTLLKGVAAGSIVPAAHVGSAIIGSDESAADASDETINQTSDEPAGHAPVIVRIVESPDTVSGGAFLEWTVEVENPTDEPVRPTLEYSVNGESLGSSTLTVEPGATERPTTPSYRTEPVAVDGEVTARVDAGGDSDERTVQLQAPPEFEEGVRFPEQQPTVQPGSTVQFEVGTGDPDTAQTTTWWVDGERVGDTLAHPWQATYYAEGGTHYWQERFETAGTSELVAGIEIDGEQYRTSWTVTVSPDGVADPSIDGARPEPGVLEVDEGTELEIDVSDPDGNLERVVWWLTQSDQILGVSDVSGASDTATLSLDGGCHTCQIVPWVITSDGTFTEASLWEIDALGGEVGDGGLEVTITETNDPVGAGETLKVTVDCENTGHQTANASVDLVVGHDPEQVDSQFVSADGGESESIVLVFKTAMVANDQSFPVRVETDGSTAERTVTVRGTGG